MDINNICFNCLKEKRKDESICGACGFDNDAYKVMKYQLEPLSSLKNGKYIIGRVLTEEETSITYLGIEKDTKIVVAIKEFFTKKVLSRSQGKKVIIPQLRKSEFEENKKRFLKEAEFFHSLSIKDKEYIVNIRDYFEENGTAYIVRDYIQGKTLKSYIEEKGKMSIEEVQKIILPICRFLNIIHEEGIVHKGIRPDNILLLNNTIKLLDISGELHAYVETSDESDLLRYNYEPLEQSVENKKIGPWSDIYSLAATIYYCLTGVTPVNANIRIGGEEDIILPSELGIKINPKVEQGLMKALELEPVKRHRTMDEFFSAVNVKNNKKRFMIFGVIAIVVVAAVFAVTMGKDKNSDNQITEENALKYEIGQEMSMDLGQYLFENYADPNLIIGVKSGAKDDGIPIVLKTFKDTASNRIKLSYADDSLKYYSFQVMHTGAYVQTRESQELGTPVIQSIALKETGTQKWQFLYYGSENGKDIVIIKNAVGSVLAPENNVLEDRTTIVLAEENPEDDTQKWYVDWEKVIFNIGYNANGGDKIPESQEKKFGEEIVLTTQQPKKQYKITYVIQDDVLEQESSAIDCIFEGWNTKVDGSGTLYNSGENYSAEKSVTLYAQWKNPKIGDLREPKRDGFIFSGWYTSPSGGSKVNESTEISSDMILYAQWEKELDDIEMFIMHLYNTLLEREPDLEKMQNWYTLLKDKKASGYDIAKGLTESSQFSNRNLSNEQYIDVLYKALLGREANQEKKELWLKKLNNGTPRENLFYALIETTEYKTFCEEYGIRSR